MVFDAVVRPLIDSSGSKLVRRARGGLLAPCSSSAFKAVARKCFFLRCCAAAKYRGNEWDSDMSVNASAWSRRTLISGFFVNAAAVSATRGQALIRSDGPPPLRTIGSQFIELRPLINVALIDLERIDGKRVSLNQFRGKVILVNFWATWCAPCRRELPLLDRLVRTVSGGSLEIIAVSIDQAGRQAVDPFFRRLNITALRPFLDPSGRIAKKIGEDSPTPFTLWGMPISYIIDWQGRLAGYITGEVDWTSNSARSLLDYYAAS